VHRSDDVNVEVVVRTRKVGPFFPGGTVDAFEVWLELQATDEKGQVLFWSGKVADDGKGQVDEGAHFIVRGRLTGMETSSTNEMRGPRVRRFTCI